MRGCLLRARPPSSAGALWCCALPRVSGTTASALILALAATAASCESTARDDAGGDEAPPPPPSSAPVTATVLYLGERGRRGDTEPVLFVFTSDEASPEADPSEPGGPARLVMRAGAREMGDLLVALEREGLERLPQDESRAPSGRARLEHEGGRTIAVIRDGALRLCVKTRLDQDGQAAFRRLELLLIDASRHFGEVRSESRN